MNTQSQKDQFELFLAAKSNAYFNEKNLLNEAIEYSLLGPGKRIRPLLCLGFAQGFEGNVEAALVSAVAIEMIHTYSLIHDDLPAMDNDDYRRGRPTNHKVHGEATAILAGDSLLSVAPEFLMKELSALNIAPLKIIELSTLLLKASGPDGMVKGQALDMKYEAQDLSVYDQKSLDSILRNIHKLKTGSIITWSCLAGLMSLSDATIVQKYKCQVESVGQRIGLLFQMVDDILDETETIEVLGKTPGKDKKSGKLTFTHLYGLHGARLMAKELVQDIQKDLESFAQSGGDWMIVNAIVEGLEKKLNA